MSTGKDSRKVRRLYRRATAIVFVHKDKPTKLMRGEDGKPVMFDGEAVVVTNYDRVRTPGRPSLRQWVRSQLEGTGTPTRNSLDHAAIERWAARKGIK